MKAKADTSLKTTALVSNIHCASCVAFIEDIFSALGPAVQRVEVNILSRQVWIHHQRTVSTSDVCRTLFKAAFEVDSATTVDNSRDKIQELDFQGGADSWLDMATNRFSLPSQSSLNRLSCFDSPKNNRKEAHIANCAACQDEDSCIEKPAKASSEIWNKLKSNRFGDYEMQKNENDIQDPDHNECHKVDPQRLDSDEVLDIAKSSINHNPPANSMILSLGGMTCASCSASITHAIGSLSYVQEVNVSLMTNSATIVFVGSKDQAKEIVETVEESGFEATIAQYNLNTQINHRNHTNQTPKAISRFEAVLNIGGMTCASCTDAVNATLRELPSVERASVALMANSATVIFSDEATLQLLIQSIKDLGYECILESYKVIETLENEKTIAHENQQRSQILKIQGMFCKHCSPRIVNALESTYPDLIIDKPPSLTDPTITVRYTPLPPDFTIRDIAATIDSLDESFVTKVFLPPTIEERSQKMKLREQQRLLRRLLLSFIIAIPTFFIGVVWMSLVPSSNKTRMFFEHSVGSGRATRAEYALFALATPVMFFAADLFHVRAIKEIHALWRRKSAVPILRRFYRFGSMNLLMSAGTSVAYFASIVLLIMGSTSRQPLKKDETTYFDSVVFLTFFILGGRYLEAYSKSKAGNAVAMLGNLRPQEATLIENDVSQNRVSQESTDMEMKPTLSSFGGSKRVDTSLLEIGDVVIVPHGSSPPADGIILNGTSRFDESSLTGESRATGKTTGDKVFAGTVNVGEPITLKITDIGSTSMLDQIISVVREGQTKRAPVERLVDSLTGYFVPIITALAILTFMIWLSLGQSGLLPKKYLDGQQGGWAFWSLEFAIAVFVVACPCGIGLAAPTALFVGGGLAAKNGILVRGGGEAFQEASNVDIVVFDKTGTLTEGGSLKVTNHEMLVEGLDADVAWAVTRNMEENSSHPIARAILQCASAQPSCRIQSGSIHEEPGLGIRGTFTLSLPSSSDESFKYEAALGSESFISSLEPSPDPLTYFTTNTLSLWKSQSKSIALLALRCLDLPSQTLPPNPWTLATIFAVTDPIRPSALPTISALQSRGIAVYMLTGDNPTTAAAVASSLSIPLANVFAGVLPTEKAAKITHLQTHGPRRNSHPSTPLSTLTRIFDKNPPPAPQTPATVAFVGDGINDSPALTAASVSISLASASDIALSSSHFVLLTSSLDAIITLLDLSRRVFRRVRFNFLWALAYNVCLVPVAAGVLFGVRDGGWRLGPVWGSAAMAGSSVSVVASSLALRWGGGRGGRGG